MTLAYTTWLNGKTEGEVMRPYPHHCSVTFMRKPRSSKEQSLCAWQHCGLPFTISMYNILYGLGMRPNTGYINLCAHCHGEEPVSVFGDRKAGQMFIHVGDLTEANGATLRGAAESQIINIASAETRCN